MQNPGRLVGYKQIIHEAWGGVQVSNHTVAVTVGEVKSVLGEYGSWITCRPKLGYLLEIRETEDLLRRGRHFWHQYTRQGFENALSCFYQAAESDEADFRVYEAIADTHLILAGFLMRSPRDMQGPFVEAHRRAVLLCGLTPKLRSDRAFGMFVFERQVKAAEAELLCVQRERPNFATLHVRLALIYAASGRLEEARAAMLRAKTADPLEPELAILEIVLHLLGGDFATAADCGRRSLDLHPNSQVGRAFYAEALDFAGRADQAFAQYDLAAAISPDTAWIRADQARCLAIHGHRAQACAILEELERRRQTDYVDAYHMALLKDALGWRSEAFAELERAFAENSYALSFSALDAKTGGLRLDPRLAALQSRLFQ